MILKEAILEEEKNKVKEFLKSFDLILDEVDMSLYLEEDNNIIGTVSSYNYIIKCLAVSKDRNGENLASILVEGIINKLIFKKIYTYQVFTKPNYKEVFTSLGFKELVSTDDVCMLEKGINNINDAICDIKKRIINNYGDIGEKSDIASVVINANPITSGHVSLIESASKKHDLVLVFLLEEDKSLFSFKERFSMAYLSLERFDNVLLLPSTKYIISSLTFPSYFLHDERKVDKEQFIIDSLLFKNYFMKNLYIKKRYLGTELKEKMINYNNTLKEVLGDDAVIIERFSQDGNIISASNVRTLLESNNYTEAYTYIPKETLQIFKMLVKNKYGKC